MASVAYLEAVHTVRNECFRGKRALVTGGLGFLGGHVVQALLNSGATVRVVTHREDSVQQDCEVIRGDLTRMEDCLLAVEAMDCVFHLAAFGWGLGENVKLHSQLFTTNVLMNTCVLEAARQAGVDRYLYASSSAVYAGTMTVLDDAQPWGGDPHDSEFAFGWAKRIGEIQARVYARQHNMKIAIVRPSNAYGPRDHFHPAKSHVVPSLIIKAVERQTPFVVWGAGRVERSFIHAADVARAMLLALEKYAVCDPINIASPHITNVAELAKLVLEASGNRDTELVFDPSKPEGHPGKYPAVKKAEDAIGFRAAIGLREGLEDTISWYRSTLAKKY